MAGRQEEDYGSVDLLYPFYLDADMSMAFAAALTGGVAFEEEQVGRSSDTSRAVKALRGNIKVWRAGGFEAGRESTEASDVASESRLIRRHTDASIFIALHDELRRLGLLHVQPDFEELSIGDLVSLEMGPAVAPLRRVIDQVGRLLDLMAPILGIEARSEPKATPSHPRSKQRTGPRPHGDEQLDAVRNYRQIKGLFDALSDDLEHSGMIDVVVGRGDLPSAVLTLDKRFVSEPTLELLHTSRFTVVGKVSEIWHDSGEVVNLYRRSVLSLVPALAQTVAFGLWALLGEMGRSFDVAGMQRAANEAMGLAAGEPEQASAAPEASHAEEQANDDSAQDSGTITAAAEAQPAPEVMFSLEAITALMPSLNSPAFQLLPLAICS